MNYDFSWIIWFFGALVGIGLFCVLLAAAWGIFLSIVRIICQLFVMSGMTFATAILLLILLKLVF